MQDGGMSWYGRGIVYASLFLSIEYAAGWMLRKAVGRCPWDYTGTGGHLHGLMKYYYAPLWYGFGLFCETFYAAVALPASLAIYAAQTASQANG
jgi:hypothetical protein